MTTDSTGRLRVSENNQIFSYIPSSIDNINSNNSYDWITTIYDAGETFPPNLTNDSVNNFLYFDSDSSNTGAFTISYETKKYMEYKAGCSRLTKIGFVPFQNKSSVTITTGIIYFRTGLIGTSYNQQNVAYIQKSVVNGIYLEVQHGDLDADSIIQTRLYFVLKHATNGTSSILQTSWNIDTFDGTGPSGKTINSNSIASNMYVIIDEEYGSGRVRVGFNIDGVIYYAHQFVISGLSISTQYIETPYLPIMYQMYTSGCSHNTNIRMRILDCSSYLENSKNIQCNYLTSIGTGVTPITLSAGNEYVVIATKLGTSYATDANINNIYKLVELNAIYNNSNYNDNDIIQVKVYLHTTYKKDKTSDIQYGSVSVAGAEPFSSINNSIFESYVGSGQYITLGTNGYGFLLRTLYVDKNGLNIKFNNEDMKEITRYDTLYITAKPSDSNTKIVMSATLKEI